MEQNEAEKGLSLADIFGILKKNILIIIIGFVVGALASGLYGFGIMKTKYTSTGEVMVQVSNDNISSDSAAAIRLAGSVAKFICSMEVANKVEENLGKDKITAAEVYNGINTSSDTTSFWIYVSFTSRDRELAPVVVDAAIDAAKEIADDVDGGFTMIKGVIVQVGRATPSRVSSMRKSTLLILGSVIGLILGIVVAAVKELASTTCHSKEDIENFDVKVIGFIPDMRGIKSKAGYNYEKN